MKWSICLVFLFCGCMRELKVEDNTLNGEPIREFEYDGCTYICFGIGNHYTITHKGNCENHK
jgi:hypothetical protein